jgi:hypothetical protein
METLADRRAIPLRDAAKQRGTHGNSRFACLPITGCRSSQLGAASWADAPLVDRFAAGCRLDAASEKKLRRSKAYARSADGRQFRVTP